MMLLKFQFQKLDLRLCQIIQNFIKPRGKCCAKTYSNVEKIKMTKQSSNNGRVSKE